MALVYSVVGVVGLFFILVPLLAIVAFAYEYATWLAKWIKRLIVH